MYLLIIGSVGGLELIMQQTIIWNNDDPDLKYSMASPGLDELTYVCLFDKLHYLHMPQFLIRHSAVWFVSRFDAKCMQLELVDCLVVNLSKMIMIKKYLF